VTRSGPDSFDLCINQWFASAGVYTLADGGLLVLLGGKKHVVYGKEFPSGLRLTVDGQTCLFNEEYDPSEIRSTMQARDFYFLRINSDSLLIVWWSAPSSRRTCGRAALPFRSYPASFFFFFFFAVLSFSDPLPR
jgi:hypothetical protein